MHPGVSSFGRYVIQGVDDVMFHSRMAEIYVEEDMANLLLTVQAQKTAYVLAVHIVRHADKK